MKYIIALLMFSSLAQAHSENKSCKAIRDACVAAQQTKHEGWDCTHSVVSGEAVAGVKVADLSTQIKDCKVDKAMMKHHNEHDNGATEPATPADK